MVPALHSMRSAHDPPPVALAETLLLRTASSHGAVSFVKSQSACSHAHEHVCAHVHAQLARAHPHSHLKVWG